MIFIICLIKYYSRIIASPLITDIDLANPENSKLKPILIGYQKLVCKELNISENQNNIFWTDRMGRTEKETIYLSSGYSYTDKVSKDVIVNAFFDKDKIDIIEFYYQLGDFLKLESQFSKEQLEKLKNIVSKDGISLNKINGFSRVQKDKNIIMYSFSAQKSDSDPYLHYFFKSNFEFVEKVEIPLEY